MTETFDVHEYAKAMFDRLDIDSERTLTGRFPSRPPLPYNFPPTNVREAMAVLEDAPETQRGLYMAMDFGPLESRTVAYIVGTRGGKMHIIEQLSMDQMYNGRKVDLSIIDDYAGDTLTREDMQRLWDRLPERDLRVELFDEQIRLMPEPAAPIEEKLVKQNGRSAAYLKHDKTKKHKRRR